MIDYRIARAFVSRDAERPHIQQPWVTGKLLAATDGHRLFCTATWPRPAAPIGDGVHVAIVDIAGQPLVLPLDQGTLVGKPPDLKEAIGAASSPRRVFELQLPTWLRGLRPGARREVGLTADGRLMIENDADAVVLFNLALLAPLAGARVFMGVGDANEPACIAPEDPEHPLDNEWFAILMPLRGLHSGDRFVVGVRDLANREARAS